MVSDLNSADTNLKGMTSTPHAEISFDKNACFAGGEISAVHEGSSVSIRWTILDNCPHAFPEGAISLFPANEVLRIARFVREPDRRLRYAAADILSDIISDHFPDRSGMTVVRDQYGRLFIQGADNVDITVSHSGDIVVCALAFNGRIGIDIEQVRSVDYRDFESVFPDSLKKWLYPDYGFQKSGYTHDESFFHAWTLLESVIKADGRGLSAPLADFVFEDSIARLDRDIWYLNWIPVTAGYICTLAASMPVFRCDVKRYEDCR